MRHPTASDELINGLKSLGCGFGGTEAAKKSYDPEQVILDTLKFYWDSNTLFFMLYSLLKTGRITHLINTSRLLKLALKNNLSNDEFVLLIALADDLSDSGHENFKFISNKYKETDLKMKRPPIGELDSFLIKEWGENKYLKRLGVSVRNFYLEKPSKFVAKPRIIERNTWLSLRSLIGVNYRADIAYLKFSGRLTTAYQAHSTLGCTLNSAYTIWNSLEELKEHNLVESISSSI